MKLHSANNSASCFLCFKPIVTDFKTDKVFSYPSPRRRSGSDMDKCFPEKGRKIDSHDDKFRKKRGFVRSFKAVLLLIKERGRKLEMRIKSELIKSISSSCSCSFRSCRRSHDLKPKIVLVKSASMRSSTSSSMLSSSSEPRTPVSSSINPKPSNLKNNKEQRCNLEKQGNLKEGSLEKKQESLTVEKQGRLKKERSGSSSIVIGMLLILISLAITVFWGRIWAIAFNAMWMAFIPESRILRSGSEDADRKESIREQRRRRVIMEGLLDRTHLHHHQAQQN